MVNEIKVAKNKDIIRTIKTPKDIQELKEQLNQLDENNGRVIMNNSSKKKETFFNKVRTIFGVGK